jgi:anoctamin-10
MPWSMPWKLPTHEIKEYFGEEIGFYFKFLAHIASGLLVLSFFAIIAQVVGLVGIVNGNRIMMAEAVFAVFAAGVYSVILDTWRYDQNKTAHLWEVFGCIKGLPPRPGFNGMVLKNPTNGRLEIDFPESKRRPRRLASLMASATAIVVMLGTVLSIFIYKAILTTSGASSGELLIPAVLNSFQMTVFGLLYKHLAEFMTEFENHRTLAEHNSELFKKLTFFYFINYYASLFYIAFVKVTVEGCLEAVSGSDHCGHELALQVLVVFVGNDFANRISNSV